MEGVTKPYLGLAYFSERDEALFREREKEKAACLDLILGYSIKFLVLHGSSGCGKSSFLRAALIPGLKRAVNNPTFFLNSSDSVVRCRADPLGEIARSILAALDRDEVFIAAHSTSMDEKNRRLIRVLLNDFPKQARPALAANLVLALQALSSECMGSLVLLLDQAEEVLTLAAADQDSPKESVSAFFNFLGDVFLKQLDVRIILSLRTEYYGRFRDELQISDDRMAERPAKGGVQAFLLHSLRDPARLKTVVSAPAELKDVNDSQVFHFSYASSVVETIVEDLLSEFPASVTPALQVVCATLYAQLGATNRVITKEDYVRLGAVRGIVRAYVETGVGKVADQGDQSDKDAWCELLYSLVSRQGGGTVVSMTESVTTLCSQATKLELKGDVRDKLKLLTAGDHPLLSGDPADAPRVFSLKHDILAVILSRRHDEFVGRGQARAEEKRTRLRYMLSYTGFSTSVFLILGFLLLSSARKTQHQGEAIKFRNLFAIEGVTSDSRQSLKLLLHDLALTRAPINFYDLVTRTSANIHKTTLEALGLVNARFPSTSSTYSAVTLDPSSETIVALQDDGVTQLTLRNTATDSSRPSTLPFNVQSPNEGPIRASVVYVQGLGPVALADGQLHFWKEGNAIQRNLAALIAETHPTFISSAGWWGLVPSPGPALYVLNFKRQLLRFDVPSLLTEPIAVPGVVKQLQSSTERREPIAFSQNETSAERFATFRRTKLPSSEAKPPVVPQDAGTRQNARVTELALRVGDPNLPAENTGFVPIATLQRPDQLASVAFLVNRDALAVMVEKDTGLFVLDFASPTHTDQPVAVRRVQIQSSEIITQLLQPSVHWAHPAMAAVYLDRRWRFAWSNRNGVHVVETSPENPDVASPLPRSPLLYPPSPTGGAPTPFRLQFTDSGKFLVQFESQAQGSQSTVRVWDLRDPEAHDQEEALVASACNLLNDEKVFEEKQVRMFGVSRDLALCNER